MPGRFFVTGTGSGRGRLRKERASRGDIGEVDEATALADHIEQIAMFAGGGVGPFAGRSLHRLLEPHEHRAARCVAGVADLPVIALASAVGQVVPAHRLGLPAETVR